MGGEIIRGIGIYFDDIIVTEKDLEEPDRVLRQVLSRANENNIMFNTDYFHNRVEGVKYKS